MCVPDAWPDPSSTDQSRSSSYFWPIRPRSGCLTVESVFESLGPVFGFFREPAVADPPRRVPRDWWFLGLLVALTILEAVIHTGMLWRPFFIGLTFAVIPAVLFRRTHPLATIIYVFVAINVAMTVAAVVESYPEGPYTLIFLLVHVYALFRWASGRHCAIGIIFMVAAYAVGMVFDYNGVAEAVGGAIVLFLPAQLGVLVRFQSISRTARVDKARSAEREQIARELHDSVAHHVSAIAIQAQAGRTLAATNPQAAVDALSVIEEAAARTLSDMRSMVGSLRGDAASLVPQPSFREIESLAGSVGGLEIHVDAPDEANAPAAVGAALFRIAQESVTNAVRHARHASRVDVSVSQLKNTVRLTVRDDGRTNGGDSSASDGYGLVGMAERARLLGGTLDAGPSPSGGWIVEAELPVGSGAR